MATSTDLHPHQSAFARTFKRLLVGRPMPTSRLAHERLGNPTALAVFASDNLSSSAYATEEIMRMLILPATVGAIAFKLVVPITGALLAVLAILLFSYRQTIKAYPQAGGAYLVTRDNFGVLPAQVAGVALLTDYILTVSVSVAAGTAALVSAAPGLFKWRVILSVAFIFIITWGNLRGVKESGRLFAVPTYFFIGMMGVLIVTGIVKMITGAPMHAETFEMPEEVKALGWFVVLKAFSSGGAAVTGVEAISNGVPAFKQPEWRNARKTLMWMGCLLGSMFLGLSVLAVHLKIVPDHHEKVTVLAQLARAVFGNGPGGHTLFLLMQAGTFLILVLAANTSFADFPRLASFHAGDRFLPRQLTRYGDRLVFSNGIITLAVLSSILVIGFKASVTKLIPLYAVGVFTSFTFSQLGMAKHHVTKKEKGWTHGLVINGLGGIVSGVMTVVIAATKFKDGAWIILIAIPTILMLLLAINRHYNDAAKRLRDLSRRPTGSLRQRVLVAVDRPGPDDAFAAAYCAMLGTTGVEYVHVGPITQDLIEQWGRTHADGTLVSVPSTGTLAHDIRDAVRSMRAAAPEDVVVNVVVPEEVTSTGTGYLVKRPRAQLLKAALLGEPGVVVTNVCYHEGFDAPDSSETREWRHVAVVLVNAAHNAALGALQYARSIGADDVRCIHVEDGLHETEPLLREWEAAQTGLPLEVIESPYRLVAEPAIEYVHALLEAPRTLVTLVVADFVVTRWYENLLHNQTSLEIKRAFLFQPAVVVTSVPYRLRRETVRV